MKRKFSICVDILMYGILLVQMLYVFLGNTAHEILGIAFFVCLVCHIVIKRAWFKTLVNGSKKSLPRQIFNISTMLLSLSCIALMLSSMGVSRLIFPWFQYIGSAALHRCLATAVLTLSVVHGGMRGYLHAKKKRLAAVLTLLGAIAAAAIGIWLVPYLNRHFKTVDISYAAAVEGDAAAWKGSKPLVVYFTRVGNTDFEPDVDTVSGASLMLADGRLTGNTELLAAMIDNAIDCDVQAITLTGTRYPSSYNDTVAAAGRELRSNARPEIAEISAEGYENVILVYPLWWGTVPMPVATFLESADLSGKHLYLIATQGSSGFGESTADIREMAAGAAVTELVSIYCDDIPTARDMICGALERVE